MKKTTNWYKEMSFYQIWPRSFMDGNGDGIGDLYGIYEKLDYVKALGVDGIWFSPLYVSPNADYGYDIADYMRISPEYGDMEIFKKVLNGAHERGLRVIMDLVINHTSDEHEWFQAGIADKNSPYHDYYFWRKAKRSKTAKRNKAAKPGKIAKRNEKAQRNGKLPNNWDSLSPPRAPETKRGKLPNNWDSLFEGKAWEYNEKLDEYYLHIFAKKQPDLNMDNPRVREEVKRIMRFWLETGIDGFREDVITFISKHPGLPNHWFMPAARGIKYYNNGPRIHEYLREFKRDTLDHYDCLTIGEAPMMTPRLALSYISETSEESGGDGGKVAGSNGGSVVNKSSEVAGSNGEGKSNGEDNSKELDLMFHFQHMEADCLFIDYYPRPFSLKKLKRAFSRWQTNINGKAWNTLYLENHDHPRIISRYGSEKFRTESGKMLAMSFLFQQGTPFIYQGQEIGMTNILLKTIDDYKDVMTRNEYNKRKRQSEEKKMVLIRRATRESARTPMQWSAEPNAGFTTGEPWFTVNPNYTEINVQNESANENSILNFYRKALRLRKETPVILWGNYKEHYPHSPSFYVYERAYEEARLLVICFFSTKEKRFKAPKGFDLSAGELLLSNYEQNPIENNSFVARPYETRVYVFNKK